MSSTLLMFALMQYVVSVKAGLVNHVQGTANVVEMEQVRQGHSIRTADNGYAEVLLTPGSFLRIGENSSVVLDGVDLESVSLRVLDGPAVIEVIDISKKYPIKVTTGDLSMNIIATGIYRFEDGVATVIKGKLRTADSGLTYEKGWQVFIKDKYRARKVKNVQTTSLDVYSQARSQTIAEVNASLAASLSPSYGFTDPYWLFAPAFGYYTFMPHGNFRSPYGYSYYAARRRPVIQQRYPSSGSSDVGSTRPPSGNTGGSSSPSGGNESGGGGGGAPAPVTVSTPAGERSAPAVYIESKSNTVGTTQ
jgi:uncharacterized membrane protein YgcG